MNENIDFEDLEKEKLYTFTIPPLLLEKLERHLSILRTVTNKKIPRHNWLLNAIQKKLEKENDLKDIENQKHMNFKIAKAKMQSINARLEEINNPKQLYSKRQWIVEAICIKLESERELVQRKLNDFQISVSKGSKEP